MPRRKLTAKKVYKKKPSARNQQQQIATLAKQVNQLKRHDEVTKIRSTWNVGITGAVMLPYDIVDLSMLPSTRTEIFSKPSATSGLSKFKMTGLGIDYKLEPFNEEAAIDCTLFIVSIKSDVQTRVWDDTGGMNTIDLNLDYVSLNGKAFMNLDRYKVHFIKRIQTAEAGNGDQVSGGWTRGYKKIKASHTIKNATGNWTSVSDNDFPVIARYFAITFNNNNAFDGEYPQQSFNCVYTGYSH